MEHWNKFKSDNGTIEYADMEQWNSQFKEVEESIYGIKHNTKDKLIIYQNSIYKLERLFYKLIEKMKTGLVSQKNINALYELLDEIECKTKKQRKNKETLEKIDTLRDKISKYLNNLNFLFENAIENVNSNIDSDDILSIIHIFISTDLRIYSDIPLFDDFCYQVDLTDDQEISDILSNDNNYSIEIKTKIKKWIYLCELFLKNNIDNSKINEYDKELFSCYKKFADGCKEWKSLYDETYNMLLTKKSSFDLNELIENLKLLSANLYNGIAENKIVSSYNDGLYLLLNKAEAFLHENNIVNQEAHDTIYDLTFICTNYDPITANEAGATDNNFNNEKVYSIKKWIETPHLNLLNKTITLSTFIRYRYIDKLKSSFIDCPDNLNTELCEINDLGLLIQELQKKYNDLDNGDYGLDYNLFCKNEKRKIISLLNVFLDGDVNFIKENGRFYFSNECLIQLNDFLDNPDDDEFIEEFKNKNIDFIIENDDSCTYLLHFHRIINDLYFNKPLQSEPDTECTIELLTHKVYNNLKNTFEAFKLNVNTKYIAPKTIINYIKIIKKHLFENTPYKNWSIYDSLIIKYNKNTNYKSILDNIGQFIKEVKKPYNQILIKNYKDLKHHYQCAVEILNGFNKIIMNKLQK